MGTFGFCGIVAAMAQSERFILSPLVNGEKAFSPHSPNDNAISGNVESIPRTKHKIKSSEVWEL